MGSNSIKILIIMITINALIGICSSIALNTIETGTDTTDMQSILETEQTRGEARIEDYRDEDKLYSINTKDGQEEQTIGRGITQSKGIFDIFNDAINPFSINRELFDNNVEKAFADVLGWIRMIMGIITIFIMYQVIKNRKTD